MLSRLGSGASVLEFPTVGEMQKEITFSWAAYLHIMQLLNKHSASNMGSRFQPTVHGHPNSVGGTGFRYVSVADITYL
jgi:hypothetical protein